MYAWIACFGDESPGDRFWFITLGFEIIFTLSIIFRLMTTFVPEGEIVPIRDHSEIFKRYYE